MCKLSLKEAAEKWVREFNAIDSDMIARLMDVDPSQWKEVTQPAEGDRVFIPGKGEGEIVKTGKSKYQIQLDSGRKTWLAADEFEVISDSRLPMWGTMWSFGDSLDDHWIEEGKGLAAMSACGFRVYYHEEWGYFFGIDGAGYDFYEAHWIPLYRKRGLHWHSQE